MHASEDNSDDNINEPSPRPSPRAFRFPAHGRTTTAPAPSASIRDCLAPFGLDDLVSAPTSPVRAGTAISTNSSSGSDTASMRTTSTVRPAGQGTASRTSSRMNSPLSFDSVVSEQSGEDGHHMPLAGRLPAKVRPTPGALKHFRSLQVSAIALVACLLLVLMSDCIDRTFAQLSHLAHQRQLMLFDQVFPSINQLAPPRNNSSTTQLLPSLVADPTLVFCHQSLFLKSMRMTPGQRMP